MPSLSAETAKIRDDLGVWRHDLGGHDSERSATQIIAAINDMSTRVMKVRDVAVTIKPDQLQQILEKLSSIDQRLTALRRNWLAAAFGPFAGKWRDGNSRKLR